MYKPDNIGLGHVKHDTAIAAEAVRQTPGAIVIARVSRSVGAFRNLLNGSANVKYPPGAKAIPDCRQQRSTPREAPSRGVLRANPALSELFRPAQKARALDGTNQDGVAP
jgi:hypothetical protein